MTRLARFDASIAGYRTGQTVDLDEVDDPRVDAALKAGYLTRVKVADVDPDEVTTETTPSAPETAAVAEPAPTPPKRAGGARKAT